MGEVKANGKMECQPTGEATGQAALPGSFKPIGLGFPRLFIVLVEVFKPFILYNAFKI